MSNLIPDLKRLSKEGSVYEGEERVITLRAATQLMIQKVRDMAGNVVPQTIFHQLGIAIGERSFEYSKGQEITADSLANVIDGVLSLRGWSRLVSLKRTEAAKEVIYECSRIISYATTLGQRNMFAT